MVGSHGYYRFPGSAGADEKCFEVKVKCFSGSTAVAQRHAVVAVDEMDVGGVFYIIHGDKLLLLLPDGLPCAKCKDAG